MPPFLVLAREGGDLVGSDLVTVGFLLKPGVVEFVENGEFLLPSDRLVGGGDLGQVQPEAVEGFMLLCFRPYRGDGSNVALDMK
ncbi:hypothetical protein EB775_08835 [Trueperella pyogenes]|uniref:hypothetical protein n=1 Tax=Trueperella pyogenes TaxID=1661 RepID=UPI000F85996D|nr:hypothetical protein [Trueperella pyogenes]AZR03394.1 hypothetical protein EB775_08835 [Trueperella pyogenes]